MKFCRGYTFENLKGITVDPNLEDTILGKIYAFNIRE